MTLRLLKVVAHAYLVDDDGEHLREIDSEPVTIAAADLAAYPALVAADIARLNEPAGEASIESAGDAPIEVE